MRTITRFSLLLVLAIAAPAAAQNKVIDLTIAILDRFLTAKDKEKSESSGQATQLAELDAKIAKFQQCKRDWETAGAATGSRLGGMAARIAIRRKCGVSDDEEWVKERNRIMAGPENAAATAGGFQLAEYTNLRDRIGEWLAGDEAGFTKAGLDLLKSRRARLSGLYGVSANVGAGGMGGGGGAGMGAGMWTPDFTWVFISQLFSVHYLSGATMFESDYKPGEWTRWETSTEGSDDKQITERAFLGKPTDGGEWWRVKTINISGGSADTISLEALFRPEPGNEYMNKLVRMRGKLPGNTEPQELIVPEQYGMWNMAGSMGRRPTKESVDGATIGTESVSTPAGTFRAKHVRFGSGMGGTLDWWLDEATVGGWVKFVMFGDDKQPKYQMVLAGKGTGARSELGVTIK